MSLLSKILGAAVDRKLEQTVKKAVNNAVSGAMNAAAKAASPAPADRSPAPSRPAPPAAAGESGFSWGPAMPAEENQYNYPGSYVDYFAHVFREDFPEYRATHEQSGRGRSTVFTLWTADGRQALKVELLPESSETKKLRRECAAMGLPYLRFYYDHNGWWNTRSYVTQRTRAALLG